MGYEEFRDLFQRPEYDRVARQVAAWIERWGSLPDDERSTVIRLSRLADYSHSKYGPTWRQLRHCRSLWNGLSSEAQTLCEEAVTLWTDALAAARDEYRHAGGVHDIPDDALRPELVIDPTSDLWTVETAAIAARWEP